MKRIFYSLVYSLLFLSVSLSAQSNGEISNDNPNATGIKSINREAELSIYPQPSNGPINITFSDVQNQNPTIMIYDLLGNLVNTIQAERINATTFSIDLSQKKPGYYFVKIQSDNGTVSRRITLK